MGMDLIGHGGAGFSWHIWRGCLGVAFAFGWEPAGTRAPDPQEWENGPVASVENWDGTYFSNAYQEVTDDDARALGLALHRALAALAAGQTLTDEQAGALRPITSNELRRLADYALVGGFAIG
jgi:hypothetical protein